MKFVERDWVASLHPTRWFTARQGTPGSRLFVHPDVRAAGHVPGWRLVVLERPGVGLSDPPPPGYTYRDFASDFR